MFKGFRIIIVCIIFLSTDVMSQQLSHQVLVPLAGVTTDNHVSYSQTVGETAVELVGCTEYFFTQGFQQPPFKFANEIPPTGNGVKVYPNPVSDFVVVELFGETPRRFRIDIINITGTVVLSLKRDFYYQYWYREPEDISHLIKGFYIIRIKSGDGMIDRSFKIEKI